MNNIRESLDFISENVIIITVINEQSLVRFSVIAEKIIYGREYK